MWNFVVVVAFTFSEASGARSGRRNYVVFWRRLLLLYSVSRAWNNRRGLVEDPVKILARKSNGGGGHDRTSATFNRRFNEKIKKEKDENKFI